MIQRSWIAVPLLGLLLSAAPVGTQAAAQTGATASGQQASTPQQGDSQSQQSIPDAPSAVQPPQPEPQPPPQDEVPPNPEPQNPAPAPANQPPPTDAGPLGQQGTATKPPLNIRTVPEGGATKEQPSAQDEFFTIYRTTNQVIVPVTVKDESGHLVSGLLAKNFVVKENGKQQKLNFFTSDPFALSAAVVLDLGMKDVDVQKVNHTYSALEGVFSPFDEVSIYSYSNAVSQLSGWGAVGPKLSATLESLRSVTGRNNGPPITSGPLGPQGPMINNMPVDPAAPVVYTPAQESHVLNDAILRAAIDLSKRDRSRRKVIFVISDGREYRSDASYQDVLKVLLTNNIMVYGVGLGGSAIPGYSRLQRLHLPRFGYSDILPKYVSATGGQVLNELTRTGIEDAYAALIGDARNQYTLGYQTHEPVTGSYRGIEVLVDRPSCRSSIRPCVNVYAKDGYYPLPPQRQ